MISVGAFRFLLDLMENGRGRTTAGMLDEVLGAEGRDVVGQGLLVPGPNRTAIDVPLADGDTVAPVMVDAETGAAHYFHPELGFCDCSPGRLRTWVVESRRLVGLIAQLLGMPASFRPVPLVEELLWDLGAPRLGRKNVPVLFGIRLGEADMRERIRQELHLRRGAEAALLLTAGRGVARDLTFPTVSKVVPIREVMDRHGGMALDLARLGALADLRHGYAEAAKRPVVCSADGSWISIHGREYTFRRKQAQIVRILYEAWNRGEEWLREEIVLAEAEYDSRRLLDAFKKNEVWREVIEVVDGRCRLRLDGGD